MLERLLSRSLLQSRFSHIRERREVTAGGCGCELLEVVRRRGATLSKGSRLGTRAFGLARVSSVRVPRGQRSDENAFHWGFGPVAHAAGALLDRPPLPFCGTGRKRLRHGSEVLAFGGLPASTVAVCNLSPPSDVQFFSEGVEC